MKISYDSETDALYIRLIEGNHECRTVRLNEENCPQHRQGRKARGHRDSGRQGSFGRWEAAVDSVGRHHRIDRAAGRAREAFRGIRPVTWAQHKRREGDELSTDRRTD